MPSGKGQIKTAVIRGRLMRYPSTRFKTWRVDAFKQLKEQAGHLPPLTTTACVEVLYTPGDRIRRDVPGIMDALCHLLEYCPACGSKKRPDCKIPVVFDDSLLVSWTWITCPLDRENPRIEVAIIPCP